MLVVSGLEKPLVCPGVLRLSPAVKIHEVEVEGGALVWQRAKMRDMPVVSKLLHVKIMWEVLK